MRRLDHAMRLVAGLAVCLLLAAPAWAQSRPRALPPTTGIDPRTVLRTLEEAFTAVADRVTPAVVNVSTVPRTPGGEDAERFRDYFGEELYERYFRRRPREDARASGSGVIVDPKGYILTNNHVIENARDIIVRLSDARKFPATLVGRQVVIVANLEARKIRGEISQGMILAASDAPRDPAAGDAERTVVVLTIDKPMPAGATVS